VNETLLMRKVMSVMSTGNTRVFRNNVGLRKIGRRAVRYGLCPGSSDLIGWKTIEITPDMVGEKVAVFLAVEVKTVKGRVNKNQTNFLQEVSQAGGIAKIVRSVEEAKKV